MAALLRSLAPWLLISLAIPSVSAQKLTSKQWLHNHCKAYQADYAPLIQRYLSRYQGGIRVDDVLNLQLPDGKHAQYMDNARPVAYLVNNTFHYPDPKMAARESQGEFSAGFTAYFKPLMERLLDKIQFPDMPIAYNENDWPVRDEDVGGGPWFGYCNVPKLYSNLPLPEIDDTEPDLGCGEGCTPFTETDQRKPQAIFMGGPTGWHKGVRRAVLVAGREHPDYVHSGINQYQGGVFDQVSDEDKQTFGVTPRQSIPEQVREYQYVIFVDGWCGSKRLKQYLASDSVVLNIASAEEEWYTALLVPGKHYIPVRFELNDPELDKGTDLIDRIQWARDHPEEVARIVQHAKSFNAFYLSRRGQECYSVQLLEEYSRLLLNPWRLQELTAGLASS